MIHIYQSKNKQFYFTVVGKNGEVVLTSETYTRRTSVYRAIQRISSMFQQFAIAIEDHSKPAKKK